MRAQIEDGLTGRACFLTVRGIAFSLVLVVALLIQGCDQEPESGGLIHPQKIGPADECHICGMIIQRFPGPKGEVFVTGSGQALKFCSTRDLFAYLMQPEAPATVRKIYVHDMAQTNWKSPSDTMLVDARSAWYVVDHPLKGAMGPTLASFKHQADAEAFARQAGGRVLRFDQINLDVIANLDYGNSKHGANRKQDH